MRALGLLPGSALPPPRRRERTYFVPPSRLTRATCDSSQAEGQRFLEPSGSSSVLECSSPYLPLPGWPPPFAPKMASSIPLTNKYYLSTHVHPNLAYLPTFALHASSHAASSFWRKSLLLKQKYVSPFFNGFSPAPSPPPPLSRLENISCFSFDRNLVIHSGGSALDRCNLQIIDVRRKKLDRSPARKKLHFPRSHADQLARGYPKKS